MAHKTVPECEWWGAGPTLVVRDSPGLVKIESCVTEPSPGTLSSNVRTAWPRTSVPT